MNHVYAVALGGGAAEDAQRWHRTLKDWVDSSQVDLSILPNGQQYSEPTKRFWRTLLRGVMSAGEDSTKYLDWRVFDENAMSWMESFLIWIQEGEPDVNFALDRSLTIALYGRCYFQAGDDGLGLCCPTAEEGDEIWVVIGSKIPFLLRHTLLSVEEADELRPEDAYGVGEEGMYGVKAVFTPGQGPCGYYNLIGDCYFDGYVHGDRAEDAKLPILLV